jgi:hypothetical protein
VSCFQKVIVVLLTHCCNSVYSLFSALIMHVYQMRSSIPSIVTATNERLQICMDALKEVSKVWLVAKMVHTLFLSILGNKVLEDKLQKAPGKKHKKPKIETNPSDSQKREYEDGGFGYTTGPPTAQVSYERSRPQSPNATPSRDLGSMPAPATLSPSIRHNDGFLGSGLSRSNTRPTTPFNQNYSIPATPPDFFLVTRSSPPISQNLWENFQPDQLFPESAPFPMQFPMNNSQNLDPALHMPQMQTPNMSHTGIPPRGMNRANSADGMHGMGGMQGMGMGEGQGWSGGMGSEDTWSNSSRGQSGAPMTLNLEDW